jgi:Zn-dependent protease
MPDPVDAIVFYVVFLFSVTFHEAAHAWAAMRGGDLTAYAGGQVSLDPRPHIRREPFGMVVLPLLTVATTGWPFGFASAPYDPHWAVRHPRRAAWMSLAGPAANLALVFAAMAALRAGIEAGVFDAPASVRFGHVVEAVGADAGSSLWPALALLLGVFFSMNLVLGALNLIPLPPLDGSGAVPILLSESAALRYQQFLWSQPMLGWIGILAAFWIFRGIFPTVFLFFVNLLHPGAHYG